MRAKGIAALLPLLAVALAPVGNARADFSLVLKKSFVEKYKNRATITSDCFIDKAHARPNPAKSDGDLHIAVRCEEAMLAGVAEIMNARVESEAVDAIHKAEKNDDNVKLVGAWRIWPEHGGSQAVHSQFNPPKKKFATTNPDHLFQIHPLTHVGALALEPSFTPVQAKKDEEPFKPKDAHDAFMHYDGNKLQIRNLPKSVELRFSGVGYNYVKFVIKLLDKPGKLVDGYVANVKALEDDGDLVVRRMRTIFVQDTPPAEKVKGLKTGDCLAVLGVPRFDLSAVSWRSKHLLDRPEAANGSLPYEMVIVGTYADVDADVCGAAED